MPPPTVHTKIMHSPTSKKKENKIKEYTHGLLISLKWLVELSVMDSIKPNQPQTNNNTGFDWIQLFNTVYPKIKQKFNCPGLRNLNKQSSLLKQT